MKKIAYLASAVLAGLGFSTAANADVTVSGAGGVEVLSAGSTTNVSQGGSVTFSLSTTTASGITSQHHQVLVLTVTVQLIQQTVQMNSHQCLLLLVVTQ